jgi:hypothetical protein
MQNPRPRTRVYFREVAYGAQSLETSPPQKYKRLGLHRKQMENAQTIARHPEAVAEVIRKASSRPHELRFVVRSSFFS